jgi:general secretion pathway protein A
MSYYTFLGLTQEPFSNSPDPDLLYRSPDTARCLQELEIAVRLHRGLNVVFGRVGTGKTTICRELLRQLYDDPKIRTFLILDPGYGSQLEFVRALGRTLGVPEPQSSHLQAYKDGIQDWLLTRVNEHGETVALLIDEGQKIRDDCLEILRELLNFETNTAKLLQIVLFAQTELRPRIEAVPNLMDRINFRYEIGPLSPGETRAMIEYRLARSRREDSRPIRLTSPASWTIYRSTRGYPRKIIHICHHTLILMASRQSQTMRRKWVLQHLKEQGAGGRPWAGRGALAALCLAAAVLLGAVSGSVWNPFTAPPAREKTPASSVAVPKNPHPAGQEDQAASGSRSAVDRDKVVTSRTLEHTDRNTQPIAHGQQPEQQPEKHQNAAAQAWPENLGTISLPFRDSVWNISSTVYDTRNSKTQTGIILPAIRQANPGLPNLDTLSPKTPIRFPVLPGLASLVPGQCRISLLHSDDLSTAYAAFNDLQASLPPEVPGPRFLALWDHRKGLRFHVVTGSSFESPDQAAKAKKNLPGRLQDEAQILDWTENSVRPVCFGSGEL